jgi:hypothetical protein
VAARTGNPAAKEQPPIRSIQHNVAGRLGAEAHRFQSAGVAEHANVREPRKALD